MKMHAFPEVPLHVHRTYLQGLFLRRMSDLPLLQFFSVAYMHYALEHSDPCMQSAQSKLEVFVPNGELTDVLEVVHVLRSGATEDTTLAGRCVSERTDHLYETRPRASFHKAAGVNDEFTN